MEPLVSIIVPVYNVKDYLNRCIDSIINQEYKNFELLLIDDGSTDESGEICDSYAEKDARVKVFHRDNSGVSASRNFALDHASGEYIQFADSDDWITPETTKLFVRTALEYDCDLVISDFYRVSGDRISHKGDIEEEGIMTRQEFANIMLENPSDFYYGVLWNKFFKREIIERIHLRMDPEISWCEDFLFNLEYIRHASTFFALQVPLYYYVKRKGSLVHTQGTSINNTIRMKLNVFEYYNKFYKDIYDQEDYDNIKLHVYRFLLSAARDGMVLPTPLPGSKKLGDEKTPVHKEAVAGEGLVMESYRFRKLLECYLQTVSKKNNLTLDETTLLLYLNQPCSFSTIKELAEFMGVSSRTVSASIQKLTKKNIIKTGSGKKISQITFLPAADSILRDLEIAQNDFDNTRFADFTDEELVSYSRLSDKIKNNMQNALSLY